MRRYIRIYEKLKCAYLSKDVSKKSIKGTHIEVMARTFIDGNSTIGDYTYIGYNCFITKSIVGRYVSIANNVSIGMGEHKINKVSTSSLFYNDPYFA
jgi:acetyltransferase-like isoleucine patch superfamily enzyme